MGLSEGYGVLKCRVLEGKMEREDTKSPHYTIIATDTQDGKKEYRIVINVKSVISPFDLIVFINSDFKHPITSKLIDLKFGFTDIEVSQRKAGGIALDFIRSNLFDVTKMKPVPADVKGGNNDVNDMVDFFVQQAIKKTTEVDIYAFGEPFSRDLGIHNIHMNQGNAGRFAQENGVFQDGALLIHFRTQNQWVAFFSAFQSQSFHTDDKTGNPIEKDDQTDKPIDTGVGTEPLTDVKPIVRIIAALVNPLGDDVTKETVTLINASPTPIDLKGWTLLDRIKRKLPLTGTIEAGRVNIVPLSGKDIQLGNDGGIITLLNPDGLKVDGVSYTKEDAKQQGYTIVF